MIDSRYRRLFQAPFDLLARPLVALGVSPDAVTAAAFLSGAGAAAALAVNAPWIALALLWLAGLCDVLDGTVARASGRSSRAGAFLDLVLDRLVEALLIVGFYLRDPALALPGLVFLALVIFNFSSFLLAAAILPVDGEKAVRFEPGLVERTETWFAFTAMILWPAAAAVVLWGFNALILVSGIRRFIRIYRAARALEDDS